MTPKEKALELIRKFRKHTYEPVNTQAKGCALIAIDEILQIVPSIYVTNDEETHSGHYQYWNEVKQEIEKL